MPTLTTKSSPIASGTSVQRILPLRIAILANGIFPYAIGGMQKHTTYLARYLAKAGIEVDLYFIKDARHPSAERIRREQFGNDQAINVHPVFHRRLPYFPGHYYLTCWWQSRYLARAVLSAAKPVDFILAQGYTGWHAMQARRTPACGLPPIGMHAHGLEALQEDGGLWFTIKNSFAPTWQRQNIRLADVNLSLGGKMNDLLTSAGACLDSILPAYNGIDEAWLCPEIEIRDQSQRTKFLFVGRDTQRKGFLELNESILAFANDPQFEMHFVGSIAKQRRVDADNFIYHGTITDEQELRSVYRSCDVLVVPSHTEGMPTVILEAMATGLAVIATDVGAISMAVDDTTGWLIPSRNPAALRQAMATAMKSDLIGRKRAGRRKVEMFTWERVTAAFLEALRRYLRD